MNALPRCAALLFGVCALSAHADNDGWKYNIGAMYEIENIEGQADDMDGLYEPSVWFNASTGPWKISVAMYQEGPVNYSNMTRGTYFNRPELEVRYQVLDSDAFTFGLTGGIRNYGYHFKDENNKPDGTANMQRYKIQPDWNVRLNDDWHFNGWFAAYQFVNDLQRTGYSDSRVETETGLTWKINETVSLQTNYYLERGFNLDKSRNNGEFSTQEMRIYLPISFGSTTLTPYTRLGLDRWTNWDWQDDPTREGHDFNRLGLQYAHDFDNGISVSLEYAYEWEHHNEGDDDRFHYAGVGINYAF